MTSTSKRDCRNAALPGRTEAAAATAAADDEDDDDDDDDDAMAASTALLVAMAIAAAVCGDTVPACAILADAAVAAAVATLLLDWQRGKGVRGIGEKEGRDITR